MSFLSLLPAESAWNLAARFSPHLRPVRWGAVQAAAIVVASPLIAALLLWLSKLLFDEVFVAGKTELLPTFVAIYAAILAGKFLLDYACTRIEASAVEQITQCIRTDLYRHLLSLSPGSLGKHGVGDQLTHLSGDVERIEFLVFTGVLALFADVIGALFFV